MMLKLVRRFPSKSKTTDDSNTPQEYRYTNTTQKSILQMEKSGNTVFTVARHEKR